MNGRRVVAAFVFFVALAIVHTWPLTAVAGRATFINDESLLHLWAVNDTARQLTTDPTRPLDGRAFYPFPYSLASLDHVIASAVMAVPMRAAGMRPAAIYNTLVILTFVLSGFFTCLLVVRLSGSWIAGLVAGSAFAFSTPRWNHVQHLHVLSIQWLPLALLALHRLLERPTWKHLAGLAAAALLLAYSSLNAAIVGGATVGLALILLVAAGAPFDRRRLAMVAVAGLLVALALVPIYRAYDYVTHHRGDPRRGDSTSRHLIAEDYSLHMEGLVSPAPGARVPYARILHFGIGESRAFPGFVTLVLAVTAVWAAICRDRRTSRVWRWIVGVAAIVSAITMLAAFADLRWLIDALRPVSPITTFAVVAIAASLAAARRGAVEQRYVFAYLALALTAMLIAFGPEVRLFGRRLGTGIFRPGMIPALAMLRTPARFSIVLVLAIAVLAGVGGARVASRTSGRVRGILALFLLLLLNLELSLAPLSTAPLPPRRGADLWLASNSEPGAVIYYPEHFRAILRGLVHERPVVNGTGLIFPPAWEELRPSDDLSQAHLNALWEHFHPRFVVLSSDMYPEDAHEEILRRAAEHPDALRLVRRDGPDYVFELTDRGRGPVLVRRWPRRMLERSTRLDFTASVTGGRADRAHRILVTLNEREFAARNVGDVTRPISISAVVPRTGFIDGVNAIELFPAYTFKAGVAGYPVGKTGVDLRADVAVTSGLDRASITVNGRRVAADKGYLLVMIDPDTGAVLRIGRFNTSWYEQDSHRLTEFVTALPARSIVAVASLYDVSRNLTPAAVSALRQLGLTSDLRGRMGWAHAAIGVKGAAPGEVPEAAQHGKALVQIGESMTPELQLDGLVLR